MDIVSSLGQNSKDLFPASRMESLVFFIFFPYMLRVIEGRCFHGDNILYNKSIDGSFVANIPTQGFYMCIRECLSRIGHCESVNFDRNLLLCRLTTGTVENDPALVKSDGSVWYTSASSWPNVRIYQKYF